MPQKQGKSCAEVRLRFTTKDAKSTKFEYEELSKCATGCSLEVYGRLETYFILLSLRDLRGKKA